MGSTFYVDLPLFKQDIPSSVHGESGDTMQTTATSSSSTGGTEHKRIVTRNSGVFGSRLKKYDARVSDAEMKAQDLDKN